MKTFQIVCQQCGKTFTSAYLICKGTPRKFCSKSCSAKVRVGALHPGWKGGRRVSGQQYPLLCETHPKRQRRTIEEHIHICESALGGPLPEKSEVHHWNGKKHDNRNENLVICQDRAYHMLLHARQRRLKDTGDFSLKRCHKCNEISPLADFPKNKNNWDGTAFLCFKCIRGRKSEWWAKNSDAINAKRRERWAARL